MQMQSCASHRPGIPYDFDPSLNALIMTLAGAKATAQRWSYRDRHVLCARAEQSGSLMRCDAGFLYRVAVAEGGEDGNQDEAEFHEEFAAVEPVYWGIF